LFACSINGVLLRIPREGVASRQVPSFGFEARKHQGLKTKLLLAGSQNRILSDPWILKFSYFHILPYLTRGRKLGIWHRFWNNRGIKLGICLRVITEAKRVTFWPRPNMPRFQTRGKMWKITRAESPYYTGESNNV